MTYEVLFPTWLLVLFSLLWTGCDGDQNKSNLNPTDQTGSGEQDVRSERDLWEDGEDVPSSASECDVMDQRVCATTDSWKQCVSTEARYVWSEETPCERGQTCQDGECVPRYGDLDCIAVSKCVASCDGVEACQEDCYYEGSQLGQQDFDSFLNCTNDHCAAYFEQEKLAAGSQCTLTHCKSEYLTCVEVGTASCSDTLKCMQNCNQDGSCIADCVKQADFDALVKLTGILVCFDEKCPDPSTWQQCATSSCLLPSLACL